MSDHFFFNKSFCFIVIFYYEKHVSLQLKLWCWSYSRGLSYSWGFWNRV